MVLEMMVPLNQGTVHGVGTANVIVLLAMVLVVMAAVVMVMVVEHQLMLIVT